MRVFLSLGSNIEPRRNLAKALAELKRRFEVLALSPVYLTAPVGDVDQPDFWNTVAELESDLEPEEIQRQLREIEQLFGRTRDPLRPYGPRTVDLDLVLVDGRTGRFGALELPSPLLARHSFLAVPLADLAPDLPHPVLGVPMKELARELTGANHRPPQPLGVELAE
jgi:2-amino-4-hydroxy-6-hydroxymethyldihydropteridine diphosphokinase